MQAASSPAKANAGYLLRVALPVQRTADPLKNCSPPMRGNSQGGEQPTKSLLTSRN